MRTKLGFLLLVLLLAAAPAIAQNEIDSVCLITNEGGRINDGTFNTFAYEGMIRAAEDFGLETTFIETIAASDYEANFANCINEGYDIVVSVGFFITDATRVAAAANPDVYFIGVDQFQAEPLPNLVGLQFREDQGGFLAGAMAALMTESGTVGGVYGVAIPPVVKFRNGFEQGVAYINPDVTALGVYIDDFNAPDRGAAAAEQFMGEDADVILGAGGPTGSGGITFAAQAGAWVIGVDQDEYFTTFGGGETPGADRLITSAIKRVDNGVYDMVEAVVNGEPFPASSIYILEVANDGIGFAPANEADVPAEVTEQVQAVFEGLADGTIVTGVDPVSGELLGTIPEVAASAGTFSTLLAAAEAAGLVEALSADGPLTVFAPTDEAFEAALTELGISAEELLADTELLTQVLTYHVVENAVYARQVVEAESLTTLQGADITVSVTEAGVVLNDAVDVVATDIPARNGLIHIIDGVLLPPTE